MAWGLLPEIGTDSSTITVDTLPPFYAQYYSDGQTLALFFNINNSICAFFPNTITGSPSGITTDTDEKAKVSSNDTSAGYLNGKLVAGSNMTLTENNDGGNETLTITASISTTKIIDADGDTKVDVEESADEDVIRMDTAGTERLTIDSIGRTAIKSDALFGLDGTGYNNYIKYNSSSTYIEFYASDSSIRLQM